MSKKVSLLLLFITSIVLISNFNFLNQNIFKERIDQNDNPALNQNTHKLDPDNPEILEYFIKVAEVPYKADYASTVPKTPVEFWRDDSGDCDDKSVAFADYLYRIGAEDVRLVTIIHQSQRYAHACVMWKNRIFDATAEPPIYNMDRARYYSLIEKQGFRLWMDSPYSP